MARARDWAYRQEKQSKMRGKGECALEISVSVYGLIINEWHMDELGWLKGTGLELTPTLF